MAVDGHLNFDTKINTKGFRKDADKLSDSLGDLRSKLKGIAAAATAAFSLKQIGSWAKECKNAYLVQFEAETRLEQVLRNTTGATREQIQSVKEWASELQRVGVIGDEVTLSGLQELGTYIENTDSLKTMSVVLGDMLAQQYGLNATAENAVTISTMLGKVLEGQTSALSRYGYSFTDAQERLLKYGTEEQRVATLAEVVEASVGGMNEALARTPAGRMKQLSNTMGDIKEQFGQTFTNISSLFIPVLESMTAILERAASYAVQLSTALADVFGVQLNNSAVSVASIYDSVAAQNELTDAVEATTEAQDKSLAGFDKINKLTSSSDSSSGSDTGAATASVPISAQLDEKSAEEGLERLSGKLQKLIRPVKLAWDANSPQLAAEVQSALAKIKGLFSEVGKDFAEVWTNGTGERYIGNIITLFGDVIGIIGDIADALKKAWKDGGRGKKLIQSYFDRWNALLELLHAVGKSFREAWRDGTGERICGNILDIITNINRVWTGVRKQFTAAWESGKTGVRIWSGLLNIANSILDTVRRITGAAAEWAMNIELTPLLESVAGLIESLEPLTENIGDGLVWFYENALLPIASCAVEKAVPAFIDLLSSAIDLLDSIILVFEPLGEWLWDSFLVPMAQWTGSAVISVVNDLSGALSGLSNWIRNNTRRVDELSDGLGILSKAFSGIGDELKILYRKFLRIFSDIWNIAVYPMLASFASVGVSIISQFTVYAAKAFLSLYKEVKRIFEILWNDAVKPTLTLISQIWQDVMELLKDFWEKWGAPVFDNFSVAISLTGDTLRNVWDNFLRPIFDTLMNVMDDIWTNHMKPLLDNFLDLVGTFVNGALEIYNSFIYPIVNAFVNKFGPPIAAVMGFVANVLGEVLGKAADIVSDLIDILKGVIDFVVGVFTGDWGRAWDGIKAIFSGVWDTFADIVKVPINLIIDLINGLTGAIESALNWIIDSINTLSWDIPEWVPFVGGDTFGFDFSNIDIPEIPHLAHGTVVPANYGEFLAVLGDNKRETEIVSPESTIRNALADELKKHGGSVPKEIVVYTYLYPNSSAFHREVISIVNSDRSRKGG